MYVFIKHIHMPLSFVYNTIKNRKILNRIYGSRCSNFSLCPYCMSVSVPFLPYYHGVEKEVKNNTKL